MHTNLQLRNLFISLSCIGTARPTRDLQPGDRLWAWIGFVGTLWHYGFLGSGNHHLLVCVSSSLSQVHRVGRHFMQWSNVRHPYMSVTAHPTSTQKGFVIWQFWHVLFWRDFVCKSRCRRFAVVGSGLIGCRACYGWMSQTVDARNMSPYLFWVKTKTVLSKMRTNQAQHRRTMFSTVTFLWFWCALLRWDVVGVARSWVNSRHRRSNIRLIPLRK